MGHTAAFIPFITGKEHCNLIKEVYGDAPLVRVALHHVEKLKECLPSRPLWIDPGVDGLDDLNRRTPTDDEEKRDADRRKPWHDIVSTFAGYELIADQAFQKAPNKAVVDRFVADALDACLPYHPTSVSIPQLPHTAGTGRNKINKALAESAAKWQLKRHRVSLVLPVILTHAGHSENKTSRNAHVKLAAQCLSASKAEACWIVDSSFDDEDQSAEKRRERMHGLVAFHREFNDETKGLRCRRIGGPYWALNLLLWSRGLVDQFGIGIGTGYQYHVSGGVPSSATAKIAIEPLYRRAKVGVPLREWFNETLASMDPSHPFHRPLTRLRPLATAVTANAKRQTALFYRTWIDSLEAAPSAGRSMALFQSLSIAFSYGRQLSAVLVEEKTTRRPESIVEPLMLNCL